MAAFFDLGRYVDETIDFLAIPASVGGERFPGGLFNDGGYAGAVCAGAVKVAQLFVSRFMLPRGSKPFDPTAGCAFMTTATSGSFRTEADVIDAFGIAEMDVASQLLALRTEATPLQDQYREAVLDKVSLAPGLLTLTVTVSTQAGSTHAIIVPVPVLPR